MNTAKETLVSVARELRRIPRLRTVFEKTDPQRRMRKLEQSGLIDTHLYAAQLGEGDISVADAAKHYVEHGQHAGLTINALIDDHLLRRAHGSTGRPPAFEYLWTRSWHVPISRLWDVEEYTRRYPDSLNHPSGPVGHAWARLQSEGDVDLPTCDGRHISAKELVSSQRAALAEWGEADALRRRRRLHRRFNGQASVGAWPEGVDGPTVSIVLATWNRAGQLRTSVESALAQTWQSWELIIVDDGSWDDTAILARLLAARDQRIVYLPRPHEGVSAARNAGIAAARGDYITFLDSDNEWESHFLENMMVGMRTLDADVAFATIELDRAGRPYYREAEATPEALALGNVVDLNTLVTTKSAMSVVGGFDTELVRAVDYDIILRLSDHYQVHHIPVLGAIYRERDDDPDRISVSQPLGWNTLVRQRKLIDLRGAFERDLEPGATVVVMITDHDPALEDKFAAISEAAQREDVTLCIAMIGPTPSEWSLAADVGRNNERVRVELFPQPEPYGYVVARELQLADRTGFVVVEPAVRFDASALTALIDATISSENRVSGPLQLHDDGTIVTLGAIFAKRAAAPMDFLSRHPVEDAERLGSEVQVPALSGRTFGMRTRDLLDVGGMDPLLYNEFELPAMCVALRARQPAVEFVTLTNVRFRRMNLNSDFAAIDPVGTLRRIRSITADIAPTSVEELYTPLGLEVSHLLGSETSPSGSTLTRRRLHPVVVRPRHFVDVEGVLVPRLRWSLRIASPAFPTGGTWGDTHFARSLAKALASLGQEVVIDHHEIGTRPTAYLDDVTLVIRGLDRVEPVTGGVSMLWIISHPEQVSRSEAAAFDRVFAASNMWSEQASARWGLRVEPLLQCTDPALFAPSDEPRRSDIVFVGKSRGVARPAVVYPVRAGIPLRVFGGEWEGILPEGYVEAEYIDNARLGELYGRAGAVLNDHWNDMRDQGFISNRLFDVVAAGGRVFSDHVAGVRDVFGDAVVTYTSPIELVELLERGANVAFPPEEQLREHAARIARDHSFRARARVLLDAAVTQLAGSSAAIDPRS